MTRSAAIRMMGAALLALLLWTLPGNAEEKGVVIKIATLAPEGSSWIKTFQALNAEIMKKTGNRVQFKIYPGGVLGDEKDMLRKMQIGQIHGAALTSGGLSVLFKEIDVYQIPFLFRNYGEVDRVVETMDPFFRKGFQDNGYELLGWSEAGFVYLMSTVPAISLNEMKKAKVWIWEESPMAKAIFDEARISAIPLSVPDVLVGLQTGLVDVVYAPPSGAIALQWFTKVKYILDLPLLYLVGGVVVKKDVFQGIPKADQDVIKDEFRIRMAQLNVTMRNENTEAMQVMEKQGVKILKPSPDQVEEYHKLWERALPRLIGPSFSSKVLDEVLALLGVHRGGKQ
jgi:TRAP-type transport system periplasmic protein